MVQSHGANSVVSMLDHYFSTHSLKESVCYCHADNCVGQNKNRFLIGYFAWRVITGRHTQIHLSFMEVGHTRCLVDGHFGLIKKSYRHMDCDAFEHLVEAVHRSTVNNIPQLFTWQWRNWETLVILCSSLFPRFENIITLGLMLPTQEKCTSKSIQLHLKAKSQFLRRV